MSYDKKLWNQVLNELKKDKARSEEMKKMTIPCQNNQSLRFYDKVVGKPGPAGYALFLCLHGGGQAAPSVNDSQWKDIIPFESNGFKSGTIAVATRGINNAWNLHFIDESYPAFTRLIENYIIFKNVDPNRVYLMGFSAGGDGAYQVSERIPYMFAACSPQAGHPNGVSTINICNLPTYLAAGEKDGAFKRNQICVDYYKKIIEQNGKYLGNYIAKVEVVAGSGHSFQCWRTPRNSFFNGEKQARKSNETAFTFMYSYTRDPNPTAISCDVKCFLTPLRNYYTPRGNFFYNIEIGKNPPDLIQLQINYGNNTINVKEGNNFRINLNSALFKKGNAISVTANGKTESYQLQRDVNYSKNNMKLFCDPNYAYDSFVDIGNFTPEVKLAYVAKAPSTGTANPQPQPQPQHQPQPKKKPEPPKPQIPKGFLPKKPPKTAPMPAQFIPNNMAHKKKEEVKLANVTSPTKSGKNPAQYTDKGKNGSPYLFVKLAQTNFAWSDNPQYWKKIKKKGALLGQEIYHLEKVFYLNPKGEFFDVPKGNYFLLLRHNAINNIGLSHCKLSVKVDGKEINVKNFFKKDYKTIKDKKGLYDDFIVNIKADMFNIANTHEIVAEITGEKSVKKGWDLDGFILLPDNCDGKIANIYHQYFDNELYI